MRWVAVFALKLLLVIMALTAMEVVLLRFIDPPCTARMAVGWLGNRIAGRESQSPDYVWRGLERISPDLVRAVQAGEDQRFLTHHGFDFVELNRAVEEVLTGGRIRGASTITMQAARSLFLWPDRSLTRKAAEAWYTVLIELFWDKKRIMEVYLNTVDWGDGIIGVEAASKRYFGKGAGAVTRAQAALLAAVLPLPHRWSPARPSAFVRQRQKKIMGDLVKMPLP
ncbi:MAG: monofunctional biosynthetic peptidoglycan transglycosylase [Deltaproteobacteria bacterium]|nr:monofunctional biosynthetic peptidoglycan transglycosylase [Deltaproteobacteria bacterium]